jgi:hypothetical protein
MVTDYVLFIHGVNTREEREKPTYADELFRLIEQKVNDTDSVAPLNLKSVPLYWGDVNLEAEDELLGLLKTSPHWDEFWFKEFREKQIMQFAGDAALYISRYVGSKVIDRIAQQASQLLLQNYRPGDRLHLVTHSWGTVILFDVLFAARWDQPDIPGHKNAQAIREEIFGLQPNLEAGIGLASIHTMGSPVALFSLIDVRESMTNAQSAKVNSHDITPRLEELLKSLYARLNQKLPWYNFAHPGDPVAYPLAKLIPKLVDRNSRYLDIQDVITRNANLSDFFNQAVSQTFLALLHGGDAHGSYWRSEEVADTIAQTIRRAARQPLTI